MKTIDSEKHLRFVNKANDIRMIQKLYVDLENGIRERGSTCSDSCFADILLALCILQIAIHHIPNKAHLLFLVHFGAQCFHIV